MGGVVATCGAGGVSVGRGSPLPEAVEVLARWARMLEEWVAWVGAVCERRARSLVGENSLGWEGLFLVGTPTGSTGVSGRAL